MNRNDALTRLYELHGDKLRYLIVGVFNTAFGYAMFLAMLAVCSPLQGLADSSTRILAVIGRNYFLIAQWSSWVLSVPVGTATLKTLVFRSKGDWGHEIFRAYFVYLPGLLISSTILWLTVRLLHLPPAIGQLLTIVVAVIFSYFGHKYFTFGVPAKVADVRPEDGDNGAVE